MNVITDFKMGMNLILLSAVQQQLRHSIMWNSCTDQATDSGSWWTVHMREENYIWNSLQLQPEGSWRLHSIFVITCKICTRLVEALNLTRCPAKYKILSCLPGGWYKNNANLQAIHIL